MSNPRYFSSEQVNAPQLAGQSGSLVNVLKKVLVTGFNQVNVVSITRSGTVATVTTDAPHGLDVGLAGLIAGMTQSEYNGTKTVTGVGSSTVFSFTVAGSPVTPATGSGTCAIAPMGWTEAYTGTNKSAFRMPGGTNQHYLRVDDNAVDSQKSASVRGYKAMSDVDTGTAAFPLTSQLATAYWHKSSTADATARPWIIVADEGLFYIAIAALAGFQSTFELNWFGQGNSWNAADVSLTLINAATAGMGAFTSSSNTSYVRASSTGFPSSCYAADLVGGTSGSKITWWDSKFTNTSFDVAGGRNLQSPGIYLGDHVIAPLYLVDDAPRQVRGILPGYYPSLYADPVFANLKIKTDFQQFPGRRFLQIRLGDALNNAFASPAFFDLDGWR